MHKILDQLEEEDSFNILCFDTALEQWKKGGTGNRLYEANEENIADALSFVDKQNSRGGCFLTCVIRVAPLKC